jgi:hypothetical protein
MNAKFLLSPELLMLPRSEKWTEKGKQREDIKW